MARYPGGSAVTSEEGSYKGETVCSPESSESDRDAIEQRHQNCSYLTLMRHLCDTYLPATYLRPVLLGAGVRPTLGQWRLRFRADEVRRLKREKEIAVMEQVLPFEEKTASLTKDMEKAQSQLKTALEAPI